MPRTGGRMPPVPYPPPHSRVWPAHVWEGAKYGETVTLDGEAYMVVGPTTMLGYRDGQLYLRPHIKVEFHT